MALLTFTPARAPSPGTTNTPELKVLSASFGDGYTQEAPDGLNHIRDVLILSWDKLHPTDAAAIVAFFVARGGTTPFYYTPSDGTVAKWTCKEWSDERTTGGMRTVKATLRQSFSLLA